MKELEIIRTPGWLQAYRKPTQARVLTVRMPLDGEVAVRKPRQDEYITVMPGADLDDGCPLVLRPNTGEFWLVQPDIAERLAGDVKWTALVPTASTTGSMFLWPVPVVEEGAWASSWTTSARKIIAKAQGDWLRVVPLVREKRYISRPLSGPRVDIDWSGFDLELAIGLAFEGRVVDRVDHPLVRVLTGDFHDHDDAVE